MQVYNVTYNSTKLPSLSKERILVIDLGNYLTKAGFASEGYPKLVFPSVVAYDSDQSRFLVGEEAVKNTSSKVEKKYPIIHNLVWDWIAIKEIFKYIFDKLNIDIKYISVLIGEPTKNAPENRKKLIKILFEELQVPKLLIIKQSEMILHTMWSKTGLVLDIGHSTGYCVPYYQGFEITPAIRKFNIQGSWVLDQVKFLITLNQQSPLDIYTLGKKLEEVFYIANNFDLEIQYHERGLAIEDLQRTFKLSDTINIIVGEERFKIQEIIFQHKLYSYDSPNLVDIILESLMECSLDIRRSIIENIIVSGGTTKLSGFDLRLKRELSLKFPPDYLIRINAHPKREWTSFLAGNALIDKELLERFWHKSMESALLQS